MISAFFQLMFIFITAIMSVACGDTSSSNPIKINEILASNTHTNLDPDFKQFSDWIELYNDSNQTQDISHFYLSDDDNIPTKWQFPDGTTLTPHDYLLIWADGENNNTKALHTNFKLSHQGGSITLSTPKGYVQTHLEYDTQTPDISTATQSGNSIYMIPTPKQANLKASQTLNITNKPTASLASGSYTGTQMVELKSQKDAIIYYTLDGSLPDSHATRYTGAIPIHKTTVLRTRAQTPNSFMSETHTQTYLIDEDIALPIISIAIDDAYLHDEEIGLFTNFKRRWMRPANIELIKRGKIQFSRIMGVRIYGGYSSSLPIKSFAIFDKKKYSKTPLLYPLFADKPQIQKIDSFVLRNSGNDWNRTIMRDGLSHALAKDIGNIDYLSFEPTVVFVNGTYYGILNLREKTNESYIIANHAGIHPDSLVLTKMLPTGAIALSGTMHDHDTLFDFVQHNTLEDNNNYQKTIEQIDLDSYIKYQCIQQYSGNSDWPYNNVKSWKEQIVSGKWRWILFDTDFGFAYKTTYAPTDVYFNALQKLQEPRIYNLEYALHQALIKNPSFQSHFVATYMTLLNSVLASKNVNKHIDTIKSLLKPELQKNANRGYNAYRQLPVEKWENNVAVLSDFANRRSAIVKAQLQAYFSLQGKNHLSIPKPAHGYITINGIRMQERFGGEYFDGTTLTIEAIADKGYHFSSWDNGRQEAKITLPIQGDISIGALFLED